MTASPSQIGENTAIAATPRPIRPGQMRRRPLRCSIAHCGPIAADLTLILAPQPTARITTKPTTTIAASLLSAIIERPDRTQTR